MRAHEDARRQPTLSVKHVFPPFSADWGLFLDVDGTLLDFASHPDAVSAEPGMLKTLVSIYRLNGGALALVSGRSLESIDAIFSPLCLPAAGLHGTERRSASGAVRRVEVDLEALSPVRQRFERFVEVHSGSLVEDKSSSLALHYRRAPEAEQAAERLAADLEAELPGDLRVQPGKMVIEVKPSGRTKGTAIAEFMEEEPFRGRTPVFLGDDATDEDGFRFVERIHGIAIKVGPGPTAARWRLDDVDEVADFLTRYEKFLEASRN